MHTPYEELLEYVLREGVDKEDRTGVGTRSIFGAGITFDLRAGFPMITTKRVFWKGVVEELLWMIDGQTNIRPLQEEGIHIWDEWADENGDLGPVYGAMWREWPTTDGGQIDQLGELIDQIKHNPDSRRLIVTAWNPEMVPLQALPPCHLLYQFYVAPLIEGEDRRRLSCQVYQRSADLFLGVPFNIASYALLTHMVAQVTDLYVGDLNWVGGDCHIYSNHFAAVEEQLTRHHTGWPSLKLDPTVRDIDYFSESEISLINYHPHPTISAPVAV
jgi:thymidylate synthase